MKKLPLLGLLFLALFSLTVPARAESADTPEITLIKNFYVTLVDTMKQGEELGYEGRVKKLDPIVRKTFNLPLMARTTVGLSWNKAPEAEQKRLVEAFSAFSVANYASQFTHFDGEQFDVIGEKPAAQGSVIVETKLTPKGGAPVGLNYLIRKDEGGHPRIVDVYLDAAISELATRRSEFTTMIKREGFPALLTSLEDKTKKMGRP